MCVRSSFGGIVYASDAHLVWEDLRERFDKVNRVRIFQLHREIATLSQGTSSVSIYFTKLKELWHDGLNESYDQARRQILMKTTAPTLNQAYAMFVQDESQQNVGANVMTDRGDPTLAMQATSRGQGYRDFIPKKKQGTGNPDNWRATNNENQNGGRRPDNWRREPLAAVNQEDIGSCSQGDGHGQTTTENKGYYFTDAGPYKVPTFNNKYYFLTIVDDHSRYTWLHFLQLKFEVIVAIKQFFNMVQTQFGVMVKIPRSDNGTEFFSSQCATLLSNLGIIHQIYLINRLPSKTLGGKVPFELLYGRKASLLHLRVIGCLCYATNLPKGYKFAERAKAAVLMGYSET
ncbi:uncharacterized protein [Nicotiana sylvestris]|uniref:uncharacterized protein n=1 Tax=Nicotiana sylvestris TaxID=4096 RepID=UPI00388C6187